MGALTSHLKELKLSLTMGRPPNRDSDYSGTNSNFITIGLTVTSHRSWEWKAKLQVSRQSNFRHLENRNSKFN